MNWLQNTLGCLVFMSPTPAPREGGSSLARRPGNRGALGIAMRWLCDSPSLRERVGGRGFALGVIFTALLVPGPARATGAPAEFSKG